MQLCTRSLLILLNEMLKIISGRKFTFSEVFAKTHFLILNKKTGGTYIIDR